MADSGPAIHAATGLLTAGLETVGTVGGCDVRLTLGNGWVSPHEPCSDGVAEDPGMPHQLAPGRRLEFRFDHEDWQIDGAGTVCGSLSGHLFVAEPRCQVGAPDPGRFSFSFAAPRVSGVHVLAISACGTQLLADATNQLCGTWFANLEVRR